MSHDFDSSHQSRARTPSAPKTEHSASSQRRVGIEIKKALVARRLLDRRVRGGGAGFPDRVRRIRGLRASGRGQTIALAGKAVRLIQSQNGLSELSQLADDGLTNGDKARDDAEDEDGCHEYPFGGNQRAAVIVPQLTQHETIPPVKKKEDCTQGTANFQAESSQGIPRGSFRLSQVMQNRCQRNGLGAAIFVVTT